MPPITALLHVKNNALRLSRALETLLPCAEIVIVDHGSTDQSLRVARRHGARIVLAVEPCVPNFYLGLAACPWVLCLDPAESLTEALQATLFEWSQSPNRGLPTANGYCMTFLEQVGDVWQTNPAAETRLVPRNWVRWKGHLPEHDLQSVPLEGEGLRLFFP
jgi:hypothetical protein